MPQNVLFVNGNTTNYLYNADGAKKRVDSGETTTDYCGNVIYENGNLSRILTTEGYITLDETTPTYHYFLKDHQGNNRVVVNQNGAVEQLNHYYPFGGVFAEGIDDTKQPYKYNGKELDRTNGLEWYDYGARMMQAATRRFTTVDPLSEKYYEISPYAYCANNPVKFVDPTGMFYEGYTIDEYGYFSRVNNEGGQKYDVIYSQKGYSERMRKDYDDTGNKTGIQISKGILHGNYTNRNMSNKSIKMPITDIEGNPTGKTKSNHAYEVKTDKEASNIMMFMDKSTNVEWGNTFMERADRENVNLLMTSHERNTITAGGRQVYKHVKNGFKVVRDDHIHPLTPIPSEEDGDYGYGNIIQQHSPNATFRILCKGRYYPYKTPR